MDLQRDSCFFFCRSIFWRFLFGAAVFLGTFVEDAHAGDAATIVFREGHVVRTNYGFKDIAAAFRTYGAGNNSSARSIIELNLEGGVFLLNISEVVIVCRDDCPGLRIEDPRKSAKPTR